MTSRTRPIFGAKPVSTGVSLDSLLSQGKRTDESQEARESPVVESHEDRLLTDAPSEIKCPICLDPFQGPVTLTCSHNVCQTHILDLAVESEHYAGPHNPFSVKCPKCRRVTEFSLGLESVNVNREMDAVVKMMLGMMSRASAHKSIAGRESRHLQDTSATRAEPRRVRFESDLESAQPTISHTEEEKNLRQVRSAQRQLLLLERHLEDQRRRLREEREETVRLRSLQYKRDRLEALSQRERVADSPTLASSPEAISFSDPSSVFSSHLHAQEFARKLKAENERQREAENARREQEIRQGIDEWKRKGDLLVGSQDLQNHCAKLDSYLSQGKLGSDEGTHVSPHSTVAPVASSQERKSPEGDDEVDLAMWEVEMKVTREFDDEISRRRMAEIAEQRARELIESFTKNKGQKSTPTPGYVPKINRLQKI